MTTSLASVQDRANVPTATACRVIPPLRVRGVPLHAATEAPK